MSDFAYATMIHMKHGSAGKNGAPLYGDGPHARVAGFTIVELLIVIVVIAILAAITIVAYNGIQQRTRTSVLMSDVSQAVKKIQVYAAQNSDQFPGDAVTAQTNGATASSGNTLTYFYNYDGAGNSYCVAVSGNGQSYYATNAAPQPVTGACQISNSLVGWWKLNGNGNDAVGANMAAITGAVSTAGQNGIASGAYSTTAGGLRTTQGYDFASLGGVSKSFWVRVDTLVTGYPTMVDIGIPGTSDGTTMYTESLSASGSRLMFGAKVSSGGNAFSGTVMESSYPLSLGVWHHVVQVLTATNQTIYIDGAQVASLPASYILPNVSQAISIGAGRANLPGVIDDVRVYSRGLGSNEVQTLYAAGAQ